jgi:hypothetical protein
VFTRIQFRRPAHLEVEQVAASGESAEIAANCGALVANGAIGAHPV